MIRYVALSVLGLALLSIGVSHAQAADGASSTVLNERDLRTLDDSLARKVEEQMRFIDMLERHLRGGQLVRPDDDGGEVLSRRRPAPALAPQVAPAPQAPPVAAAPVRTAPWWEGYTVDMIVHAPGDSLAVINARVVRPGDLLAPGVEVGAIREDRVLIYRGQRRADLVFKAR